MKNVITPELKELALGEYRRLYAAPFKYESGTIFDARDNMVLQIRGWGRIQYATTKEITPAQIQDGFGEHVCDLLNAWYNNDNKTLSTL